MPRRQRRQQPPLKIATSCFITGTIALIGAIVFPLISVTCTNESGVQFCIETTYDGLDAHTFGIVLGVVAVLFFAAGVFYLRRHKQALLAKKNGAISTASQQMAPQQPGVTPPVQQSGTYPPAQQPGIYPPVRQSGPYPPEVNANFPGNYAGNGWPQPPSNTFPRQ